MRDKLFVIVIACIFGTSLVGCETNEGPAERAGEQIDNAVEKAGEKIEEADDKIREETGN